MIEYACVAIVTVEAGQPCVGADMKHGQGAAGDFPGTFWEKPTLNSFESGWEIFKPVIAAVNGYCLGYGLTLVSWCDFVVASEQAVFGFPEVKLGVPTIVGAIRLPARLGWQHAMELLLTATGSMPGAPGRSGWPGGSCPTTSSCPKPGAWPTGSSPPLRFAARATKEVAMRAQHLPPLEAIRFGETMRKVAAATDDAAEGMRAAREGRAPQWRGR